MTLPEDAVTAYNAVRERISNRYLELRDKGGWRAVGREFRITAGMAFRIAIEGYIPKDRAIRILLGIPTKIEVEPCPICGKVHIHKHPIHRIKPIEEMTIAELRWRLLHKEDSLEE